MPGMTGGQGAAGLTLLAAFRADLLAEGTLLFLLFVLLAIGWVACREVLLARARAWLVAERSRRTAEPAARRVLRIGFGVLWIIDGLLQAQPGMPGGLASQVISPAADGAPGWVGHVAGWAAGLSTRDPVQAAAGAVWIQLGLGIWLVSVSSPRWSRLAGLASAGWGLVVWVCGEAFGGLFTPAASWLTGAPGAALFYVAAGLLLAALPVRCWREPWLGRHILRGAGVLLAVAAVAQAWPGRGFWQGTQAGPANSRHAGPLPAAIASLAQMRQPAGLHDVLIWFAGVTAAHGFAVNLVAVIVLGAAGAGLLTGRPEMARPAAGAAVGFCLADWVLVQDIGVFGGTGTDPNSMLPQALILTAGLLVAGSLRAARSAPAPAPALARAAPWPQAAPLAHVGLAALRPGWAARRLSLAFGTANASAVLTVWAVAMVLLGAAPLAVAAVHAATPAAAAARPGPARAGRPMLASAAVTADSQPTLEPARPGGAGLSPIERRQPAPGPRGRPAPPAPPKVRWGPRETRLA